MSDTLPEGFEIIEETSFGADLPEGFEIVKPEQRRKLKIPNVKGPFINPAAAASFLSGIPGIGQFIEPDESFTEQNLIMSTALPIGGALTSTMGPAGKVASMTGSKLLPFVGGQAGLFGTVGTGDALLGGSSLKEAGKEGLKSAGLAALGAGVVKGVTPKPISKPKFPPKPSTLDITVPAVDPKTVAHLKSSMSPEDFKSIMETGKVTPKGTFAPGVKQTQDMLKQAINKGRETSHAAQVEALKAKHAAELAALKEGSVPAWAKHLPERAIGGAIGHMVGGVPGMLAGAVIGPGARRIGEAGYKAWQGNQLISSPTNRAFLSAVLGNAGISN